MTGPLRYQVDDGASHDEDVPHAGAHDEGIQSMASHNAYDPGPSFVDSERPTDRLTEMPAWLQTFAAQQIEEEPDVDESDARETEEAPATPETSASVADPELPDWLQGDAARPAMSEPAETPNSFLDSFSDPSSEGSDAFISEDDLPDWLRAFSNEVADSAPAPSASPRPQPARVAPAQHSTSVRVPPVENVWLSAVERQALGPGATLFALLASNNGTADTSGGQAFYGDETQASSPSNVAQRSSGTSTARASATADQGAGEVAVERSPNSRRMLLLSLLLVMLVILVSIWQFS